jgi:hypothetical protein
MPRITIQQFRAILSGASEGGAHVQAYRQVARRPALATVLRTVDWAVWPPAAVNPKA